ncbi:MAG: DegT/DnrJ/EryC1/StrS family aminotransferase [Candidatus Hodarchaeota archaeon]
MDKLAMDGGPRAITLDQDELLKWPKMGPEEEEAVLNLMRKGEISTSSVVDDLAKEFGKFTGSKYVLPQVNGTSCLLSAFHAMGIGPGDEVIAPTNTYWATAMPAAFLGAKIVFCESDPVTLCIDPDDIEKKINEKTKAIGPVHIYGYPCEMDRIMELAGKHDIKVIEDASHAHGAEYKGKKIGTIGDAGVFSMQGSKIMPAGEAGILVTEDQDIYECAVTLGHYERIPGLETDKYKKYSRTGFGVKHRPSPLHAAIALCQLRKFPEVNARITKNCVTFRNAIRDIEGPGFVIPDIPKHIKRVYFMNQVLYEEGEGVIPRKDLAFMLQSEGLRVGSSRYELLHKQAFFTERGHDPNTMKQTQDIVEKLLSFPNFPWDMTGELVEQYIHGVEKVAFHLRNEF